jgi:hypothetical protein
MDQQALRSLIRRKLQDRSLPLDSITRVWSSPSTGETCDACDTGLAPDQLLMKGLTLEVGRRPFQMHVRCFQVWEHEQRAT